MQGEAPSEGWPYRSSSGLAPKLPCFSLETSMLRDPFEPSVALLWTAGPRALPSRPPVCLASVWTNKCPHGWLRDLSSWASVA